MYTSTRPGTALRQRMIDDMRMRKLEPKTQDAYIRAVRKLAAFLARSPDTATVEELRSFQLHLVDTGASPITASKARSASGTPSRDTPEIRSGVFFAARFSRAF